MRGREPGRAMRSCALQSTSNTVGAIKKPANLKQIRSSPWDLRGNAFPGGAVIQRKAGCACGGGCPDCKDELEEQQVQTKTAISSPGDSFEQEADRVADQVMRMPDKRAEPVGVVN